MVSVECMLISILVVSDKALEMLCAVVVNAMAPQTCNLQADNLLTPL